MLRATYVKKVHVCQAVELIQIVQMNKVVWMDFVEIFVLLIVVLVAEEHFAEFQNIGLFVCVLTDSEGNLVKSVLGQNVREMKIVQQISVVLKVVNAEIHV